VHIHMCAFNAINVFEATCSINVDHEPQNAITEW